MEWRSLLPLDRCRSYSAKRRADSSLYQRLSSLGCSPALSESYSLTISKVKLIYLTELVVEVHVSDLVELHVVGLNLWVLIVLVAWDRDKLKVTNNDDSKLRSIELGMIGHHVWGQQRSSAQLFSLRMKREDSLPDDQRCNLVFFDELKYLLNFMLWVFIEKILRKDMQIPVWIRHYCLWLHWFYNVSVNIKVSWEQLLFLTNECFWESSRSLSLSTECLSYQWPFESS